MDRPLTLTDGSLNVLPDKTTVLRVKRKKTEEPAADLLLLPMPAMKRAAFRLVDKNSCLTVDAPEESVLEVEFTGKKNGLDQNVYLNVLTAERDVIQEPPSDSDLFNRFHRELTAALSNADSGNHHDDYIWDVYELTATDSTHLEMRAANAFLFFDDEGELKMDHFTDDDEDHSATDSNAEEHWANEYPDEDEYYDESYFDEEPWGSDQEDESDYY